MLLKRTSKISLSLILGFTALASSACSRGNISYTAPSEAQIESISSASSDNEYLIKRRGLSYLEGDQEFQEKYGLTIEKRIKSLTVEIVKIDSSDNVEKLKSDPSIEYVEPNYIRRMNFKSASASGEGATAQSVTANISSVQQVGIAKANSIYKGKPFTTVAVLSTGVDLRHPDLKGKLATGYSAFGENDSAQDINGVGTHQAGVIVASNPSANVYGVAPGCKVMPVKVMDEDGNVKDGDFIDGAVWAIDHGANVLTFTAEGTKNSKAIDDLVKYAYTKKVPIIVGSGDEGDNSVTYPASTKGVIAVASLSQGKSISTFSNKGEWVSVSAPGENIMSTSSTNSKKLTPNYAVLSGTSVAAAYAAGEVALIQSKYPTLDMLGLRNHLELTCDDIGSKGPDNTSGFGIINVVKALSTIPPKSATK